MNVQKTKALKIIGSSNSTEKIKAVIFDFDGVLSSFQARIGWPMINAALRCKEDFTKEQMQHAMLSVLEMLTTMNTHPNPTEMVKLIFSTGKQYGMTNFQASKFVINAGIIYAKNRKKIVPREGVNEVLQELLDKGYKLILLTNSSDSIIEAAKESIPEIKQFDLILTRENFEFIKPNPDGFYFILEKLNLESEEVISVGDQATDIIASRKADIKSIAIFDRGMNFTKPQLANEKPNFIITKLRDIPKLLEVFKNRNNKDEAITIDLTVKSIDEF